MKKIVLFATLCMVFFGIVILNVSMAKTQEIKTEEGIPVVFNQKEPSPPLGAKIKFVLEEELCIGCNVEEPFFNEENRYIYTAIDNDSNIYTLDLKKVEIRKFSRHGQLIKIFGRKGEPGELKSPYGIMISAQNELVVRDSGNGTLNFYSLAGEFLRYIYT